MTDFSEDKIKDFKYWEVYAAQNQGYLGRCVIWCKREGAEDVEDATKEEWLEFLEIILELKGAVKKAFDADWFNYAFLGNVMRHLHCHLVPRYKSKREFNGFGFEDKLWGHNYKTDRSFETPKELRMAIKEEIRKNL